MSEEEKKAIERVKKAIENDKKYRFYYADYVDKNFIHKDKIREKIKEYDNEKYEYLVGRENIIIVLNELLEE